jgi:uncharacterized protein
MRERFDRTTSWIVDRPWISCLVITLLTAASIGGYTHPDWFRRLWKGTEDVEEAQANEPAGRRFRRGERPPVESAQLARGDAVLVVHSPNLFTPAGAAALRAIVDALQQQDYIASVMWLDRVPILNIFGLPEPILPRATASPQTFAASLAKARANPLVKGQVLSDDARTTLMFIQFDWDWVRNDDQVTTQLREIAAAAAASYPEAEMQFMVTGQVPMYVTAVRSHERNQWRYRLIGYGVIVVMSIVIFRGLTAVFVVALAPALGVFWTLGIIRYLDYQDNPFNDVVLPVMLSLVGLTDGVHLMTQIRRLRAGGMSGREAARGGVREVGMACLLTSITTGIGFASLVWAHHPIVREFGVCCVFGVVLTFLAVMTAIPLATSTWLGRRIHIGHEKNPLDRSLDRISSLIDFVLRRAGRMSAIAVGTTAVCTLLAFQLRPDERVSNQLPDSSEARQAMKFLDQALGGLEQGTIEIRWSERVPDDAPEIVSVISAVDDLLRAEPLVGHPISLRNLIDAQPGEGPAAERVSMIALLPPPLKRAFYEPEEELARVNFRIQDLGISAYAEVFGRIEKQLEVLQEAHPDFTFAMTGSAVWRWRNLYQIVIDLATSLGGAAVVIFLVLAVAYRSLRIGLISIVPNLFPLAITGAYLYLSGQSLEIVSVCAFTVCLGIAVDDTIHFLTRYQEELRESGDPWEASKRAFTGVGSALIMTTIVLVAGFATVLLSDSRDHRIFATMGILTLSSALLADLIFLPALLLIADRAAGGRARGAGQ